MELTDQQLDQIEARLADTKPLPAGSHVQRDPWHTASAIEEILDVHTPALIAEVRSLRARIADADYLHSAYDILDVDDTCEDCDNSRHGFEGEGGDWLCPDQYVATACCTCRDTDGDPHTWPCPTHAALHPEEETRHA